MRFTRLTRLNFVVLLSIALAATLMPVPSASAQTPPIAPIDCSFSRNGDLATITWTPAPNDGSNRYVIERNRNNLGWFWADRINTGRPLISENTVNANDDVQYRIRTRNANDQNSPRTTCTETGSTWVTQALWDFDNTTGPVVDSLGGFDGTVGLDDRPDLVGASPTRRPGSIYFNGSNRSVVRIPVDASPTSFNPGGAEFRYRVDFTMGSYAIGRGLEVGNLSQNLMQRGFFGNPGGQWKLQIVNRGGQLFVQCLVQDGQGGLISQRSQDPIVASANHLVQCEFNDITNQLQVTFDDRVEPWTTADTTFGDVDVTGTPSCSGPNQMGDAITIGNKPACNPASVGADDRFRGTVKSVEVQKRN